MSCDSRRRCSDHLLINTSWLGEWVTQAQVRKTWCLQNYHNNQTNTCTTENSKTNCPKQPIIKCSLLIPWNGGGCMIFHFWLFKSILFFVELNSIVLLPYLIKHNNIMIVVIVFWFVRNRPSGLFFHACFASFHTYATLFLINYMLPLISYMLHVTIFVCFFILFHSCCSRACVFWKTYVHEFLISYSYAEW